MKDAQTYFGIQLERLIDKLIILRLNSRYQKYLDSYKNVINILEEAKINAENNKYFELSDALDVFPTITDGDELYDDLKDIYDEAEDEFFTMLLEFFVEDEGLRESTVHEYVSIIKKHSDLYEEVINFIMNNCDFDDDWNLVNVCGHNAKYFYQNKDLSLLMSYLNMIKNREKETA